MGYLFGKKSKSGFTLMEIIVIISILGILVMIAIPRYSGFRAFAQTGIDHANARLLTKISYAIEAKEDEFPSSLEEFNLPSDYLSKTIVTLNPKNDFIYDNTTGKVTVVQIE